MKKATQQLFAECPHHVCGGDEVHSGSDTVPANFRGNGVYSLLFLWQMNSSGATPDCILQAMPLEAGAEAWWPLDLS